MQTSFTATLTQMAVMFSFISIGFLLVKSKVLNSTAENVIGKILSYIFLPSLTIGSFISRFRIDILKEKWQFFAYGLGCVLLALFISYFICKPFSKNKEVRSIFRYALTFANFGFLGTALVRALFGEDFLFDYLIFTMPLSIVNHVWGITLLLPEERKTGGRLKLLLNPFFISTIIGIVLGVTCAGDYIPGFVSQVLSYSADCMAPCAMLLIGIVIGNQNIVALLKIKKIYVAAALRLFVIPTIIVGIVMLTGAGSAVLTFALFAYATPLGMNTILVPATYNGDTLHGAGMAVISHTLCVISIPFLYWLLTMII